MYNFKEAWGEEAFSPFHVDEALVCLSFPGATYSVLPSNQVCLLQLGIEAERPCQLRQLPGVPSRTKPLRYCDTWDNVNSTFWQRRNPIGMILVVEFPIFVPGCFAI